MTTTESADAAKQFAGKMLGLYTGAVLTTMIDIGYQTGLFEAAKRGRQARGRSLNGQASPSATCASGSARW